MKIKEAILKAAKEVDYIDAKILMKYILDKPENYLISNSNDELAGENEFRYFKNIEEIKNGMPLQYITNSQEFMGEKFYVDNNVLIPQPDTEVLVEKTLEIIKKYVDKNNNPELVREENKKIKILDLCTGSGAIAISLKKYLTLLDINSEITASDISDKALKIAKKNAKDILKEDDDIIFVESDLFKRLEKDNKFDIIVSNPPYIETDIIKELDKDVQNEPIIALDGGKDGLEFYKLIEKNIHDYLEKQGYLLLEIGFNQRDDVMKLYKNSECIKDYAGNDRVIIWKNKD